MQGGDGVILVGCGDPDKVLCVGRWRRRVRRKCGGVEENEVVVMRRGRSSVGELLLVLNVSRWVHEYEGLESILCLKFSWVTMKVRRHNLQNIYIDASLPTQPN